MNTNPDETMLALWLDDELAGADLAAVEAWASDKPDELAAREAARAWRAAVANAVPANQEPPYPDFFNSRVLQGIRNASPAYTVAPQRGASWKSWLMPMAACAGVALAFWVGTQNGTREYNVAGAPKAIPVDPIVYTPESGVDAEWFASDKASATVIVLNGVAAIPDDIDFSDTVYEEMEKDSDSTAGGGPTSLDVGL